jgi:hypothetical protein
MHARRGRCRITRRSWWTFVRGIAAGIAAWTLWGNPQQARAVTYLEQAERLQFVYAFLLDYRPAGAPRLPSRSVLEAQAEVIPAPDVDHRVGAKDEPIDPPPAIPRARLKYLSASGLMAGVTVSPPVAVLGYSAPWLGGELGWRTALGPLHGELRGYLISAQVTGPITGSGASDTFDMVNQGADLRLGLALGPLMPYGGAGSGHSESTLAVESDGAELDAETDYQYWMLGVTYDWAPLFLTFEQHRTEIFLSHFILAVGGQF